MRSLACLFFLAFLEALPAAPAWESVFSFSEMKTVPFEKLEKGEVVGVRTELDGSELTLGAESFYAVQLPPEEVLKKMSDFSTASLEASETLDVKTHLPVSRPATQNDFSGFVLDLESKSARWFLKESSKSLSGNTGFNLSAVETEQLAQAFRKSGAEGPVDISKELTEKIAQSWRDLFRRRAESFQKSGLLGSAPYQNGRGSFDLGKETLRALKSRPKVLQAFAGVLDPVMAGRAIPNGKAPTFYWENSAIQGDQTISLAALFSQPSDGGYRVAEVTYYVTGKYYISLILYQLIPAEVGGKKGTFIYRSDFVITPSIIHIKGIERIAAENILLLEIKKSVRSFIQECNQAAAR